VEFVDDEIFERQPAPTRVRPNERSGRDDARGAVYARGLRARNGVGPLVPVHDVEVVLTGAHAFDARLEHSPAGVLQRNHTRVTAYELNV